MAYDDDIPLSHEALRSLQHDIQRDAARTRGDGTYDARVRTQRDAELTEAETGTDRHHNAF